MATDTTSSHTREGVQRQGVRARSGRCHMQCTSENQCATSHGWGAKCFDRADALHCAQRLARLCGRKVANAGMRAGRDTR